MEAHILYPFKMMILHSATIHSKYTDEGTLLGHESEPNKQICDFIEITF